MLNLLSSILRGFIRTIGFLSKEILSVLRQPRLIASFVLGLALFGGGCAGLRARRAAPHLAVARRLDRGGAGGGAARVRRLRPARTRDGVHALVRPVGAGALDRGVRRPLRGAGGDGPRHLHQPRAGGELAGRPVALARGGAARRARGADPGDAARAAAVSRARSSTRAKRPPPATRGPSTARIRRTSASARCSRCCRCGSRVGSAPSRDGFRTARSRW